MIQMEMGSISSLMYIHQLAQFQAGLGLAPVDSDWMLFLVFGSVRQR
jgi:hypothetical protein